MVVIVMRQTSNINYSLHFSFYPKKKTKKKQKCILTYIYTHTHLIGKGDNCSWFKSGHLVEKKNSQGTNEQMILSPELAPFVTDTVCDIFSPNFEFPTPKSVMLCIFFFSFFSLRSQMAVAVVQRWYIYIFF